MRKERSKDMKVEGNMKVLLRCLERYLYRWRNRITVRCSSCSIPIPYLQAIGLHFMRGKQVHDVYFCQFACLDKFLKEA